MLPDGSSATEGSLPEVTEGHFTAHQSAYLATDDEERLHHWFGQLSQQDFKLDVLYQEPGLGEKGMCPLAIRTRVRDHFIDQSRPFERQLDPQPDGVFGLCGRFYHKLPVQRVMFPVLEHSAGPGGPGGATRCP